MAESVNVESGSSLAAALARDVQFINDDFYDEPGLGEALDEIIAAARERLRLSRIPCESCDGTGVVDDYYAQFAKCLSCGGSGEAWAAALIRVVMVGDFRAVLPRGEAIAILDAIDLWMKEAK